MSVPTAREAFASEKADLLASQVEAKLDTARLRDARGRTRRFVWYSIPGSLTLVVGAHEKDDADRALAVGLAERRGTELRLLLPEGWHEPTMHRWAWLQDDLPLRVWTHDNHQITERGRPEGKDSAALVTEHAEQPQLHLGDKTAWVADLMDWAGQREELDPAHRSSFRAWQYRGQQVLLIKPSGAGLVVVGGIMWGPASPNAAPERFQISRPLTLEQLRAVKGAVAGGCRQRDAGGPAFRHDEHWLQATLRRHHRALGLEQPVLREVAAWRPRGSAGNPKERSRARGFVDPAGLNALGTLMLVETKLGADDMHVLQGLDYWIWAQANRRRLTARFDCRGDVPIEIVYCVGSEDGGPPISSSHLEAQLDALHRDIRWRLVHVTDWSGAERPTVTHIRGSRQYSVTDVPPAGAPVDNHAVGGTSEDSDDVKAGADLGTVSEGAATTPAESARHRRTEVTLADRGQLLVQAHWGEGGKLLITGQDLGDLPWVGATEYEYGITVAAESVPVVVEALGGSEGDDLLALLAVQGEAIVARGELNWLRDIGAHTVFWSRVE